MMDFRYKRCLREYLEYRLRVHMLCKYERKWPHSVLGAAILGNRLRERWRS